MAEVVVSADGECSVATAARPRGRFALPLLHANGTGGGATAQAAKRRASAIPTSGDKANERSSAAPLGRVQSHRVSNPPTPTTNTAGRSITPDAVTAATALGKEKELTSPKATVAQAPSFLQRLTAAARGVRGGTTPAGDEAGGKQQQQQQSSAQHTVDTELDQLCHTTAHVVHEEAAGDGEATAAAEKGDGDAPLTAAAGQSADSAYAGDWLRAHASQSANATGGSEPPPMSSPPPPVAGCHSPLSDRPLLSRPRNLFTGRPQLQSSAGSVPRTPRPTPVVTIDSWHSLFAAGLASTAMSDGGAGVRAAPPVTVGDGAECDVPPVMSHHFLADEKDLQSMEQSLLSLLDDFRAGRLKAVCDESMSEMRALREKQERLARLHFQLFGTDADEDDEDFFDESRAGQLRDGLRDLQKCIQSLSVHGQAAEPQHSQSQHTGTGAQQAAMPQPF